MSGRNRSRPVCRVQEGEESDSGQSTLCQVRSHGNGNSPPIEVKDQVGDYLIKMKVDTGRLHVFDVPDHFSGVVAREEPEHYRG